MSKAKFESFRLDTLLKNTVQKNVKGNNTSYSCETYKDKPWIYFTEKNMLKNRDKTVGWKFHITISDKKGERTNLE